MATPTATPQSVIKTNADGTRSFILFYHFRAAAPLSLVFEMKGNLTEAIERGKTHCQRMNYRFIKVRPFVVDLDERENRRNEGDNFYHEDM